MSTEGIVTHNKRRAQHDERENTAAPNGVEEARKRRAFLHTMGQQLREFGTEGASPQDHGRTTFGTSPGSQARPGSRATNATAIIPPSHHVDTPESDAAPGEDDELPAGAAKSASRWLWKVNEVLPIQSGASAPTLLFEDLLDWSQSYFDHWHPAFPFLHAPSLIEFFRQTAQCGLRLPTSSPPTALQYIILRSVMSISISDRRQMAVSCKALPSSLVFHSFNDAINSIQLVLTEESSILSLQALVSVQLFLITMHRYNAASRLEGLAVRLSFQLGLHRCPNRAALAVSKEAELRKRLFWSVFCIDRYICIRLGTPLGIRPDEMDVCFPHVERHDGAGEDKLEPDNRLSLLEFLARQASVRGSIMENRNKVAIHGDYIEGDQVMEVEAEHTRWWNTVDEYLSNDDGTGTIIKAHQVTLIVLRFESVLALHRSVLATSKKNATYNAALQRCISASRSIINTLHKAIEGFGAFDGSPGQRGYESTPLIWPSFTWAVWMSVFIVIFAATEGQVTRDVALRLADRSIQILQHLALRGTSWPEACIVAVKNLTVLLREGSTRSSTAAPANLSASSAAFGHTGYTQRNRFSTHDQPCHKGPNQRRSGTATPRGGVTMPSGLPANFINAFASAPHNLNGTSSNDSFNASGAAIHNASMVDGTNPASAYLAGAGNFLGIAQQSSDNPIPNDEIMHLFNGEDMAYWLGGDLGFAGGMA